MNKQELINYVVNSHVRNELEINELLRLIHLLPGEPELNENQQVVLEWLKNWHDNDPFFSLADLYDSVEPGEYKYEYELDIAYEKLSEKDCFQVLAAFAEWGMKEVAE